MRHRTVKNKQKTTRKNPNKERYIDVKGNTLDFKYIKEHRKKSQAA